MSADAAIALPAPAPRERGRALAPVVALLAPIALVNAIGFLAPVLNLARMSFYEVEPTGPFEDDPNVTDKKFPGNPTRSYRSSAPLRVVREVAEWPRLSPEELASWRARLAALRTEERGEIIN